MPDVEKIACDACYELIDAPDRYCRHCGRQVGSSAAAPREFVNDVPPKQDWKDSKALILVMLFLGLGPLALPSLWRGRAFARREKILLTIAVLVLTVVVVWLSWIVLQPTIEAMRELQEILNGP